jgi:short-subunit dehydrogenase
MPSACITGATSGIGRAFAEQLAAQGYNLILTGRRHRILEEAARELRKRHGGTVEICVGDLAQPETVEHLRQRLIASPVDLLIHNAGFGHPGPFWETPLDQLAAMRAVHMGAATELLHGVLRRTPPPQVILVSSLAAFFPAPGPALYTATKMYLVALGRALAPFFAQHGAKLQVLCPGFTHTEFHDRLDWDTDRRRSRGLIRWATADAVAAASLRALERRSPWADAVFVPGVANRILRRALVLIPGRVFARLSLWIR